MATLHISARGGFNPGRQTGQHSSSVASATGALASMDLLLWRRAKTNGTGPFLPVLHNLLVLEVPHVVEGHAAPGSETVRAAFEEDLKSG